MYTYTNTHTHTHHVEQYKREDEEYHGWSVHHFICHKFSKSVLMFITASVTNSQTECTNTCPLQKFTTEHCCS
jgi:lipoprotein NlpI